MAKVVAPVTARVEVISKAKQSQHGDGTYRSVLFLDESLAGDDAKIWKNLTEDEVSQLRKGDRVQLVPAGKDKNGNDKHNIVLLDAPTAPPQQQQQATGLSVEQKQEIARYAEEMSRLYKFCFEQAKTQLASFEPSEETIRAAASSVFISCQRRFNLDK